MSVSSKAKRKPLSSKAKRKPLSSKAKRKPLSSKAKSKVVKKAASKPRLTWAVFKRALPIVRFGFKLGKPVSSARPASAWSRPSWWSALSAPW